MRLKFPESERPKILQASQASLWKPEGKASLEYLRNVRGLSDDVIRQFQIGYCPANVFHELAGRIIMPLLDPYGKEVVAFTSRDPNAEKRYQHWHESFDKTRHLYGLNLARAAIQKQDKAIIVEGQFDVTYLHTRGFNMTVGLCGTAMSITHVTLLARFCSEIYFLLDPDTSGDNAVARAKKMYREYNLDKYQMNFFPVELPDKFDPDDFVREWGDQALINLLKETKASVLNG